MFRLTFLREFGYAAQSVSIFFFFFFNDTATTEIYTLSLHDALPIFLGEAALDVNGQLPSGHVEVRLVGREPELDRKSTRLNSSHPSISYAVFCLKKKKNKSDSVSLLCRNPSPRRTSFAPNCPSVIHQ